MSDEVPGYHVSVHRSLTGPMLVAGVPPKVGIGLGMVAAIFVGAWHMFALLPVVAVAYLASVAVCRRDPHVFEVVLNNRGGRRYVP